MSAALPPRGEVEALVDCNHPCLRIRGGVFSDNVINLRLRGFSAWHRVCGSTRSFRPRVQDAKVVSHKPLCKIMMIRRMELTASCYTWPYAACMRLQLTIEITCYAQRMLPWNCAQRLIQSHEDFVAFLQPPFVRIWIPSPLIDIEKVVMCLPVTSSSRNANL